MGSLAFSPLVAVQAALLPVGYYRLERSPLLPLEHGGAGKQTNAIDYHSSSSPLLISAAM